MSFSMETLFLDLAGNPGLLALVDEHAVLGEEAMNNRTSDAAIVPMIEALLRRTKKSYKDLTRIVAVTGPGGFMSLRVGLSIANALSWSLKIPIGGVHLSDLWFVRTHRSQPIAQSFLWLHSTKRDLLFIRGFGELAKRWPGPTTISLSDAATQIPKGTQYVGELIEEHAKTLVHVEKNRSMKNVGEVLPTFLGKLTYDSKPLEPWYGREG
jgi:tRNA threonylcarbamoyladenosine biosynthesis protein TsaB